MGTGLTTHIHTQTVYAYIYRYLYTDSCRWMHSEQITYLNRVVKPDDGDDDDSDEDTDDEDDE